MALTRATNPTNALLAGLLMLALTACSGQDDSSQINEVGIERVVKEINQAHNRGVLKMAQLEEHLEALGRYTDGRRLTEDTGALGTFYADNLEQIYRGFVTLQAPKAFLIIHSTVKTGEAYRENRGAFAGEETLAALNRHQQELMLRYGN